MSNKDVEQQINWNVNQVAKKLRLLKAIAKDGDLTGGDVHRINQFVKHELLSLSNTVEKRAEGEFVEPEFNIEDK